MILVWLTPPTEHAEWSLTSREEKMMDPHVPEREGAWPWAAASGLSEGVQCPHMHTHCPSINHWLVSKKSTRHRRMTIHTCLQKQLWGEVRSLQQHQIRVGCHILMLLFCQGKKRKMENKSSCGCFTHMRLKKKGPVKQSCRNFLLIVKGFLFSILTLLNKEYFV